MNRILDIGGVILALAGLAGVFMFLRRKTSTSIARLVNKGAVRRPLSTESKDAEYLGWAIVPPVIHENNVRALLKSDGIILSFRGFADELFLPISLVSLSDKSWPNNPLTFGHGRGAIELDLGEEITKGIQALKQKESSNKAFQAICDKSPQPER